jgi:hypothetical protein
MRNKVNITVQLGRLQWWEWFMKYTVELSSDGLIYVPVSWRLIWAFRYYWGYYLDSLRGCSVGTTQGKDLSDLWCMPLRWHRHTKFHDDRLRNSSNNKGSITSTTWEAVVLVILMRVISQISRWDGLGWHDISRLMAIGSGIRVILRVLSQQFERL